MPHDTIFLVTKTSTDSALNCIYTVNIRNLRNLPFSNCVLDKVPKVGALLWFTFSLTGSQLAGTAIVCVYRDRTSFCRLPVSELWTNVNSFFGTFCYTVLSFMILYAIKQRVMFAKWQATFYLKMGHRISEGSKNSAVAKCTIFWLEKRAKPRLYVAAT